MVHISLVGCLRNQRGKENKRKQTLEASIHNDDDHRLEEINYITDDDNI